MESCDRRTLTSGRALLTCLDEACEPKTGAEVRAAEAEFRALAPFSLGMDPPTVEFAARAAIRAFRRLPAFASSDPHAVQRMLLEKLPSSMAQFREDQLNKLYEAEVKGRTEWSVSELIACIAIWLRPLQRDPPTAYAAHHGPPGEIPPPPPPDDSLPIRIDHVAHAARSGCFVCGKQSCSARDCTLRCNQCSEKVCPGARDSSLCVVFAASPPIQAVTLNALGQPVPERVFERLLRLWYEHDRASKARANAAFASLGFDLGPDDPSLFEHAQVGTASIDAASQSAVGPLCL